MGTNMGPLVSGIIKGIAQGRKEKSERERQAPLLKAQSEKAKLDLQKMKMQMSFLDIIKQKMAESGGTPNPQPNEQPPQAQDPTQFGESFKGVPYALPPEQGQQQGIPAGQPQQGAGGQPQQPQRGVSDMLAGLSMNDLIGLKVSGGPDLTPLASLNSRNQHNKVLERNSTASLNERMQHNDILEQNAAKTINLTEEMNRFKRGEIVYQTKMVNGEEWKFPVYKTGEPASTIAPYKAKDKKGLPVEAATKLQGMSAGVEGIQTIFNTITKPDGSIDKEKLFQLKPLAAFGGPVPDFLVKAFSDQPPVGQQMHTLIAQAYESLIRGESGAAVPEEELVRLSKRYGIDWTQDDKTVKLRMNQLMNVLQGTIKAIDPKDRYLYNKDDVVKRIHKDGIEEYVLLPTVDDNGLQIGKIYPGEGGSTAEYLGGGKWRMQ